MDSFIKRPLKIKHLKDGFGTVPEPSFLTSTDKDSNYNPLYTPLSPVED